MENSGKRTGTTDKSITNKINEIEERNSSIENTTEDNNTLVKDNV